MKLSVHAPHTYRPFFGQAQKPRLFELCAPGGLDNYGKPRLGPDLQALLQGSLNEHWQQLHVRPDNPEAKYKQLLLYYLHAFANKPTPNEGPLLSLQVARQDGDAVALGDLRLQEPGVGLVTSIYVKPEARRQGLAQAVVTQLIEAARRLGLDKLCLKVHQDNPAAIRLYEQLGFRETGDPCPEWQLQWMARRV